MTTESNTHGALVEPLVSNLNFVGDRTREDPGLLHTDTNGAIYLKDTSNPVVQDLKASASSRGGVGCSFIRLGSLGSGDKFVVPKIYRVVVLFSGAKIDLSNAIFVHPETEIMIFGVFGKCTVILPPGVRCESHGIAVLSQFSRGHLWIDRETSKNSPLVKLTGCVILGGGNKVRTNAQVPQLVTKE